jgi:hypothetical protein
MLNFVGIFKKIQIMNRDKEIYKKYQEKEWRLKEMEIKKDLLKEQAQSKELKNKIEKYYRERMDQVEWDYSMNH